MVALLFEFYEEVTLVDTVVTEEMKRIREYVLASEPAETGSVMIAGSEIETFITKHAQQGGIEIHESIWSQIKSL